MSRSDSPDRLGESGELEAVLAADPLRGRLVSFVGSLSLPDCWIAAGFVREAVWDQLHGWPPAPGCGDVDVIWFDRSRIDPSEDRRIEAVLRACEPEVRWSVKNQARMHARNDDPPYASASDAMRHWPETATAVGVRRGRTGALEIAAPLGLTDLFGLILRPGPRFREEKRPIFETRIVRKGWLERWPMLRVAS